MFALKKQKLNGSSFNNLFRKTVQNSGTLKGKGLHSGEPISLTVHPAKNGEGIYFFKKKGFDTARLEVKLENVIDTSLAVTVGAHKFYMQTIEHLMFAIFVLGITDLAIEVNGSSEIPIMDGSALPFIDFLENLEFHEFDTKIEPIEIKEPVMVTDGNRYLTAMPSEHFQISYSIDYQHPLLKNQSVELNYNSNYFKKNIGKARTFGFLKEVEILKQNGLGKGGNIENVLIFTHDSTLNKPRFEKEALYHKILDLIGDLALIGRPLRAHVIASRAGHALDVAFGKKVLQTISPEQSLLNV